MRSIYLSTDFEFRMRAALGQRWEETRFATRIFAAAGDRSVQPKASVAELGATRGQEVALHFRCRLGDRSPVAIVLLRISDQVVEISDVFFLSAVESLAA